MNYIQHFFSQSILPSVGFEKVKRTIESKDILLINTLLPNDQDLLIYGTIPANEEENLINEYLDNYELSNRQIILYGRNATDSSVDKKYYQLISLGCKRVFIYRGGLFEWLLLQDIYGFSAFPTTKKILDILKYK